MRSLWSIFISCKFLSPITTCISTFHIYYSSKRVFAFWWLTIFWYRSPSSENYITMLSNGRFTRVSWLKWRHACSLRYKGFWLMLGFELSSVHFPVLFLISYSSSLFSMHKSDYLYGVALCRHSNTRPSLSYQKLT